MINILSSLLNTKSFVLKKWFKIVSIFFLGQGAYQSIQLLSGFLLINWLSIESYAQYSIAFAFQGTAHMLVEAGFSGSIIALVGNRINDKKILGNYIKSGKYYRNRLFVIIAIACILLFPILTAKHQWPLTVTILLLVSILMNIFFSGNGSYYSAPLKMQHKLKDIYSIQIKNGSIRLLLIGIFYFCSTLNAWLAAFTTTFITITDGLAFRKKAEPYIIEPEIAPENTRKEMVAYLSPIMPSLVFAAFQGQIMLFIISIFGETQSIAEVGALGRLGQIFLIFQVAGSTLVVPYLAKQNRKGLTKKIVLILVIAGLACLFTTIFAYILPQPFLWVMGAKYAHLNEEVGLLVLNASIVFVNVLMWNIICSRKWLWNWIPFVSITLGILTPILLVSSSMDLSTTRNVLIFSIILNLVNLSNKILIIIIGLNRIKS